MFSDSSTTTTSPEEEISKEVDRCNGELYMQIKHIVKSLIFVPEPAVVNSRNSLANHSTKKYATTHLEEERCAEGHDGLSGSLEK